MSNELNEKKKTRKNEMGAGGVSGFQLPIGAKARREAINRCIESANDISEAHLVVFFNGTTNEQHEKFFEALDFLQDDAAADMVREQVIREVVRKKIGEVVRKKAGGGGFTLYAPNKGKKHGSKPVGSFPTKLAAKRAELARFPPKDPKKLARLRKEVDKLMKDPKKRAEAEMKARQAKGTDKGKHHKAGAARGKHFESFNRDLMERAILSKLISRDAKVMAEGLFREERQGSEWDDFISKVSDKVLQGDKRYQRIQKKMEAATEGALAQALKIIQKQLGSEAKVKAAAKPGSTDSGQTYIPFHISLEAASIGPIYLYVDKGVPAIEFSDEAKNSLTKVTPGAAKAVHAAVAGAQDSLERLDSVQQATAERDALFSKLEHDTDRMIASMSPLQISMLKQLLVKKYRSISK